MNPHQSWKGTGNTPQIHTPPSLHFLDGEAWKAHLEGQNREYLALRIVRLLNYCQADGAKLYLIVVLICVFLISKKIIFSCVYFAFNILLCKLPLPMLCMFFLLGCLDNRCRDIIYSDN